MSSEKRYLKAIYELTEEGDKGTNTSQLADHLEVSSASVTEAIQKLEDKDLVCRAPYKGFTLSPMGREEAQELAERQDVLEDFFSEIGVESASEDASAISDSLSTEAIEKIKELDL
ncbi:MAG: metal-dependent transcriptional regulator [Candidatus Nanohaloarchaea archaeon]